MLDPARPTITKSPEAVLALIEFRERDLPGFASVNRALGTFEPKLAYSWHLSLRLQCKDLIGNRLPSPDEQEVLYEFEERLSPLIEAGGNALFLARVTHDAIRELIWRARDPEVASSILQSILRTKDYPRELDYRMVEDRAWRKAAWYLNAGVQ